MKMASIGLVLDRRLRMIERQDAKIRRRMRNDALIALALLGLLVLSAKLAPWFAAPPPMY